jgi:hypothetical protein
VIAPAILLLLAVSPAPPLVRVQPQAGPVMPSGTIPARARAVADHVEAIYKGDLEGSLRFVADNVENSVSNLSSNLHFPPGKTVTRAMYLSMTRKGKLGVSNMGCAPEGDAVRCEFILGTGADSRHFTMRYFADGGPITRILSWENHKGRKR